MQIQRSPKVHDVVIIGSGASGGMAAWNLTRKGIDVLMLDAGVKFDRAKFWSHVKPWEVEDRLELGQRPPQFYLDTKEQPYATLKNQPFDLVRVWGRGGKTNVWGRVSLRYSDVDFTNPDRDGWEIPWPIRYKDIAPYYDQVDQLIGVCGGDDDQDSLPGSRFHLPPPAPRCGERLLQKAARGTGEGHRPWDLGPNSMMTNANVDTVVQGTSGRNLKLSYKGGSNEVTVPPNVPVVTFTPATHGDLTP